MGEPVAAAVSAYGLIWFLKLVKPDYQTRAAIPFFVIPESFFHCLHLFVFVCTWCVHRVDRFAPTGSGSKPLC